MNEGIKTFLYGLAGFIVILLIASVDWDLVKVLALILVIVVIIFAIPPIYGLGILVQSLVKTITDFIKKHNN